MLRVISFGIFLPRVTMTLGIKGNKENEPFPGVESRAQFPSMKIFAFLRFHSKITTLGREGAKGWKENQILHLIARQFHIVCQIQLCSHDDEELFTFPCLLLCLSFSPSFKDEMLSHIVSPLPLSSSSLPILFRHSRLEKTKTFLHMASPSLLFFLLFSLNENVLFLCLFFSFSLSFFNYGFTTN